MPLKGLIRPFEGLIRHFKGLIRPLKGLLRPFKGLIRPLTTHPAPIPIDETNEKLRQFPVCGTARVGCFSEVLAGLPKGFAEV